MKNRIIFTLSLVLVVSTLFGQRKTAVYTELLGSGIAYTFNAEVPVYKDFAFRLGAGLVAPKGESFLYVPAQVNYVWGEKHGFELGAGLLWMRIKDSELNNYVYPGATLMYRYQNENGFLFRAGLAPTIVPASEGSEYISSSIFLFWPGISAGYRF